MGSGRVDGSRGECGPNLIAEISGGESSTAPSKDTKAMGVGAPGVKRDMVDCLRRVKDDAPVSKLVNVPGRKYFNSQHGSGALGTTEVRWGHGSR